MNKIYCVACEEIDPDIQKDNPGKMQLLFFHYKSLF